MVRHRYHWPVRRELLDVTRVRRYLWRKRGEKERRKEKKETKETPIRTKYTLQNRGAPNIYIYIYIRARYLSTHNPLQQWQGGFVSCCKRRNHLLPGTAGFRHCWECIEDLLYEHHVLFVGVEKHLARLPCVLDLWIRVQSYAFK